MLLADTVAVVHGAAVVLMLTGAVVALWRPRILWVHLPVSLAILAVNRAGAPCPLTELELWLRAEAGHAAYEGGYLGHYVLSPLGFDVASSSAQAGIYTVAIVPNAVAFGLLAYRALRGRRPAADPLLAGQAPERSRGRRPRRGRGQQVQSNPWDSGRNRMVGEATAGVRRRVLGVGGGSGRV